MFNRWNLLAPESESSGIPLIFLDLRETLKTSPAHSRTVERDPAPTRKG
jgi:hypothetical protein